MIQQIDSLVEQWVRRVAPRVEVSFEAPPLDGKARAVYVYLFETAPESVPRNGHRAPLRLKLCYLVAASDKDRAGEHRLIGELAFAAMERAGEFEVEAVPAGLWESLDRAPRPSFVLRVPLTREREEKRAPLVRSPLEVRNAPMIALAGVVVGPGKTPIMGAHVELPALRRVTQTNSKGAFRFAGLPAGMKTATVLVRAKGTEKTIDAAPLLKQGRALVIDVEPVEA